MPQEIVPIEYGKIYHIYNRAINNENLFRETANYKYFLNQYEKYIEPVAETFAWCLMPNHFHVLVRIKEENKIGFIPRKKPLSGQKVTDRVDNMNTPSAVVNPDGGSNIEKEQGRKYNPSNQFSHLFNSYTQAYNKRFNRYGGLFQSPFKRIWVDDEKYFKNLVIYIHNNPVHHGFAENTIKYLWTSYSSIISEKPTKLMRKEVIDWFEDIENFKYLHKGEYNDASFDKYLID